MTHALDQLTIADFSAHVKATFRVTVDKGDMIDLELIEAKTIGESRQPDSSGVRRQPFSLIFRGPRDTMLPQRIHQLEHPTLGTQAIFLVPLGPDGDPAAMHYQAIFN